MVYECEVVIRKNSIVIPWKCDLLGSLFNFVLEYANSKMKHKNIEI